MIMYHRGLGGGLVASLNALAPARMWAYALICGVIGFGVNALLGRAVRFVLPGSPANVDVSVSVPSAVAQPASPLRGLLPLVAVLALCGFSARMIRCSFRHRANGSRHLARFMSQGH